MRVTDQVYRNLKYRGVVYSIRRRGRVVKHAGIVHMIDVSVKNATDGALQRVRNGPREVCMWLRGNVVGLDGAVHVPADPGSVWWRRLECDPRVTAYARDAENGEMISAMSEVILTATLSGRSVVWFKTGD